MKTLFTLILTILIWWSHAEQSDSIKQRATIFLQITVILEGPHIAGQDYFMHTLLQDNNLLPYNQPYAPELPYYGNPDPLWYYSGGESFMQMPYPGYVVDWVLVELRDAPSAQLAHQGTVVGRKAALLLKNGMVVDTGSLPLIISVNYQHDLYAVVYHRNHLAVMSSGPLIEMGGSYFEWDFTSGPAQAYGAGQKYLGSGLYGMISGDGDANGQIQSQDKNNVWEILSGQSGYLAADFDLNGQVQTQDINNFWEINAGMASQVPATAIAQDGQPCPGMHSITDARDGNIYNTVYIGGQCWLAQNLKYLPQVNFPYESSPAVAYYYVYDYHGNDVNEAKATDNYQNYGVLYNWLAATQACPAGWQAPTDQQWTQLAEYLTGHYPDIVADNAGNTLKSCRQVYSPLEGECNTTLHPRWDYHPEHYGTDIFGFAALPAGYSSFAPPVNFLDKGQRGLFWTGTDWLIERAYYRTLNYNTGSIYSSETNKYFGFSVRCISIE